MSSDDLRERVARLEVMLGETNADVAQLHAAVHGPPRIESVRGRLHLLENNNAAANAATAAIDAMKMMQEQTVTRRFTRAQIVIGLLFAGLVAGCSITSTALAIAFHH